MQAVAADRRHDSDLDLAFAEISGLRKMLDARAIEAAELAEFYAQRLARLGPRLGAIRALLPERMRTESVRADRILQRAARDGSRISALLGIPYAVKDVFPARGGPTSFGVAPLVAQELPYDAFVVTAISRAGGVLVAKLALTKLLTFDGHETPADAIDGAARNPWDTSRWTGGSSSGPAAAVSAGLVPFALGSDAGGSISMPAAYCGLTALRPSQRAVPEVGAMPCTETLATSGPLGHSAEDCATVFEALVRRRPVAERPATRLIRGRHLDARSRRAIRIGFHPYDFDVAAAPEARPALNDGLRALWDLGFARREIALAEDLPVREPMRTIALVETARDYRPFIAQGVIDLAGDRMEHAGYDAARSITAVDYLDALAARGAVMESFGAIFDEVDLLVSFTAPSAAPSIDLPFEPIPATGGNTALLYAGVLAGLPSITLPVGLTADGLPIGMQLVGRRGWDRLVLEAGIALQATTTWHRCRPRDVS